MLELSKSGRSSIFAMRRGRANERLLEEVTGILFGEPAVVLILEELPDYEGSFPIYLRSLEGNAIGVELGDGVSSKTLLRLAMALGPDGCLKRSGFALSEPATSQKFKFAHRLIVLQGSRKLEGFLGMEVR